jgi:hypothetical protein
VRVCEWPRYRRDDVGDGSFVDRVEPAASPAMSAMPPKAEVSHSCSVLALTSGMLDGGHGAEVRLCPLLRSRTHHRIDQQSRKQQQPCIAVGLEDAQA